MPSDKKILDTQYRNAAKKLFEEDGSLEIDPNATISRTEDGDDGAYVQAWVWVPNEDAVKEES